jgi:hypothetical protein
MHNGHFVSKAFVWGPSVTTLLNSGPRNVSLRVLVHPVYFLPRYNLLKGNPNKNKAMLEVIENVKSQLEHSPRPVGIHHKYATIPKEYKKKYELQILYHFEMPEDHRLMYTIRKSSLVGDLDALFLELLSHDEYNKLFGYFKKKSH